MNALEKNIGAYRYLKTLEVDQIAGKTLDPCPICKNDLNTIWYVFPCGHGHCPECIQIMFKQVLMYI